MHGKTYWSHHGASFWRQYDGLAFMNHKRANRVYGLPTPLARKFVEYIRAASNREFARIQRDTAT